MPQKSKRKDQLQKIYSNKKGSESIEVLKKDNLQLQRRNRYLEDVVADLIGKVNEWKNQFARKEKELEEKNLCILETYRHSSELSKEVEKLRDLLLVKESNVEIMGKRFTDLTKEYELQFFDHLKKINALAQTKILLIEKKIARIRAGLFKNDLKNCGTELLEPESDKILMQEKVSIPTEPKQYNLVHRIVEHRGMTAKELELATNTKIQIHGSLRDQKKRTRHNLFFIHQLQHRQAFINQHFHRIIRHKFTRRRFRLSHRIQVHHLLLSRRCLCFLYHLDLEAFNILNVTDQGSYSTTPKSSRVFTFNYEATPKTSLYSFLDLEKSKMTELPHDSATTLFLPTNNFNSSPPLTSCAESNISPNIFGRHSTEDAAAFAVNFLWRSL